MNKTIRNIVLGVMLATFITPIGLAITESHAQNANWRATKCALYQTHRDDIRAQMPANATSTAFDDQEDEFVASGCTARAYVCPQNRAELEYANLMSVVMMNEGATGSFLPFACKETGR